MAGQIELQPAQASPLQTRAAQQQQAQSQEKFHPPGQAATASRPGRTVLPGAARAQPARQSQQPQAQGRSGAPPDRKSEQKIAGIGHACTDLANPIAQRPVHT